MEIFCASENRPSPYRHMSKAIVSPVAYILPPPEKLSMEDGQVKSHHKHCVNMQVEPEVHISGIYGMLTRGALTRRPWVYAFARYSRQVAPLTLFPQLLNRPIQHPPRDPHDPSGHITSKKRLIGTYNIQKRPIGPYNIPKSTHQTLQKALWGPLIYGTHRIKVMKYEGISPHYIFTPPKLLS